MILYGTVLKILFSLGTLEIKRLEVGIRVSKVKYGPKCPDLTDTKNQLSILSVVPS